MSSLTKRDVVRMAVEGIAPPYVPWHFGFTAEARTKLIEHFGTKDIDGMVDNHLLSLGSGIAHFENLGNDQYRDIFGVVWDRSVDKDIGIVCHYPLSDDNLAGYAFPDPTDTRFFHDIPDAIAARPDRFRVYCVGFSLFERAWTLRGMENLMVDFMASPSFVHELLTAIADWNVAHVKKALEYEIDAVYFGDDWGQQQGLIMGPDMWRNYIKPQLARMYGLVREAGKHVFIHSCGDVDELFEELVDIGVNCFNPFQPEVMNVWELLPKWRGRLAFHGGLSTQRTLPQGSVADVHDECCRLLDLGAAGGYIFAPAHDVEGDVPVENMLEFIRVAHEQSTVASRVSGGA